mgnify:CR=1 FL=1
MLSDVIYGKLSLTLENITSIRTAFAKTTKMPATAHRYNKMRYRLLRVAIYILGKVAEPAEKFIRFVKAWWSIRSQRDPEKIAQALGRPDKLELTEEQANKISASFTGWYMSGGKDGTVPVKVDGLEPAQVAKEFFNLWPRTDFRYFMAPNERGDALEFTNGDATQDGIELIQAAMVKLGAITQSHLAEGDESWYYQLAHPMTKRLAEIGSKPVEVKSSRGGIV